MAPQQTVVAETPPCPSAGPKVHVVLTPSCHSFVREISCHLETLRASDNATGRWWSFGFEVSASSKTCGRRQGDLWRYKLLLYQHWGTQQPLPRLLNKSWDKDPAVEIDSGHQILVSPSCTKSNKILPQCPEPSHPIYTPETHFSLHYTFV
ncbi:Hypothetical predicted protein [Pelobates cultripes]|uniref:Uncharacterized protein n=1 Tax=Pelobates cultripes TaxID=61616 RepID=A0AAD1T3J6_PELCU|nr:Hypothetical predicted protein [Pelobates cultripes]